MSESEKQVSAILLSIKPNSQHPIFQLISRCLVNSTSDGNKIKIKEGSKADEAIFISEKLSDLNGVVR